MYNIYEESQVNYLKPNMIEQRFYKWAINTKAFGKRALNSNIVKHHYIFYNELLYL